MPINPRALSDNPLTGTTSHSMNHRESPPLSAGARRALRSLSLLLPGSRTRDSTGHASTAPRLPAGRRRTWRRIPTLPGHGRRSSVALRKKHATARSRGAASGSCATPGESKAYRDFRRAGRTLLPTARPLGPRGARTKLRSPSSRLSLRRPRRLRPNLHLVPLSLMPRVPRFDRKTFSRIFKSPDQPDRRMRST